MSKSKVLRGRAWDHPRACNPLEAISTEWSRSLDVTARWDVRPLQDFEDQPLEDLATAYDLVLIDYPFVGTAAHSGLIAPVNDWTDATYLENQANNSTGPSFASYTWEDRQWALAIDAAWDSPAVNALVRDFFLSTRLEARISRDPMPLHFRGTG